MAHKTTSDIGEFGLIERISAIVAPTLSASEGLVQGIGDDCAVWRPASGQVEVASTDLLIEQVHFDLLTTPARHLGSKAISVNASDICAMNALPRHALVSIAVPPSLPVEMIEQLYLGMAAAAREYGIAIAGGDTSSSRSGLVISVTVTGEAPEDSLTYRKGAQPGDLVCVTGTLGGSAAGLRVLTREKLIMMEHLENNETYSRNLMADLEEYSGAIQQHLLPLARLDIVDLLHERGASPSAMIDVSDGLGQDLRHICRASGTGALLQENRIPVNSTARLIADELQDDALAWAISGGEDYQLLFTMSKEEYEKISDLRDISVIGAVTPKEEGILLRDIYGITIDLEALPGFDHFR
ncbi:thiamine-phosphate kinase [Chlorobium sp. N1]|uniref:thiamine-phosphate kinase n=1 Tax=Chlorobium sp. N1 TaxID=2491138 RepID=UPI001039EE98|nr:thiamine-phosphate kinase [Chlorobium sp. N1]TCD47997.1 thiamine-phosphate kinase [Chlorobium sp. N1]